MSPDPEADAFVRSIFRQPDDTTARLVFADWLDEHSRSAQAEFIRAQVEAETLHRHSARRHELEARAETLLAEHWVQWWSPVCESVGLPVPAPARASRLGRFVQSFSFARPTGYPYSLSRVTLHRNPTADRAPLGGFDTVEFRRGFPQCLKTYLWPDIGRAYLPRWTEYPLARLQLNGVDPANWHDGPQLAGVSALELDDWEQDGFTVLLRSKHLTSLDDLTLMAPGPMTHAGVPPLCELAESPFAPRLRRLSAAAYDDASVSALATGFPNLTALEVELHSEDGTYPHPFDVGKRLVTLGASPRLAGLGELDLYGGFLPHALSDASGIGHWKNLRRLSLDFRHALVAPLELPHPASVPALEDLSITGVEATPELVETLVASPLTKQVRHFELTLWQTTALRPYDWRRMADIVDPARIETFWLAGDHDVPEIGLLRDRLGDKLRTPR